MGKYEKIIESAIKEFAEKGYLGASTNKISKSAKVSKGTIFYFFKSKEKLYIECLKKIIGNFEKLFLEFLKKNKELDFFDLIISWSYEKIKLMQKNQYYFMFLKTTENLPENLKKQVLAIMKEDFLNYIPILREKFEQLNVKSNLNKDRTFQLTLKIIESISKNYYNNPIDNYQEIIEELKNIVYIIKFGILQ